MRPLADARRVDIEAVSSSGEVVHRCGNFRIGLELLAQGAGGGQEEMREGERNGAAEVDDAPPQRARRRSGPDARR